MIWNAVKHDYCVEPCIRSLAACCDEVVVGYSNSEDGTLELLQTLAREITHLRIENVPSNIPDYGVDGTWMLNWMDRVRATLKHPYQVQLDADEILADWSIGEIHTAAKNGASLWCKRHNFWGRLDRLAPYGHFCGAQVIRCAPSRYSIPADFPVTDKRCPVLSVALPSNVEIFHYGTLRITEAYLSKAKPMHLALLGNWDGRLEKEMKKPGHWTTHYSWDDPLIEYHGRHPTIASKWLKERGWLA